MKNLWNSTMPHTMESKGFIPHIKEYVAGSKGAVIVCPGGGYGGRAVHE